MLQLLHEALPSARRVAVFVNDNAVLLALPNIMRPAAQRLGIELITFHMRMPSDAEAMISDAQQQRAESGAECEDVKPAIAGRHLRV